MFYYKIISAATQKRLSDRHIEKHYKLSRSQAGAHTDQNYENIQLNYTLDRQTAIQAGYEGLGSHA